MQQYFDRSREGEDGNGSAAGAVRRLVGRTGHWKGTGEIGGGAACGRQAGWPGVNS